MQVTVFSNLAVLAVLAVNLVSATSLSARQDPPACSACLTITAGGEPLGGLSCIDGLTCTVTETFTVLGTVSIAVGVRISSLLDNLKFWPIDPDFRPADLRRLETERCTDASVIGGKETWTHRDVWAGRMYDDTAAVSQKKDEKTHRFTFPLYHCKIRLKYFARSMWIHIDLAKSTAVRARKIPVDLQPKNASLQSQGADRYQLGMTIDPKLISSCMSPSLYLHGQGIVWEIPKPWVLPKFPNLLGNSLRNSPFAKFPNPRFLEMRQTRLEMRQTSALKECPNFSLQISARFHSFQSNFAYFWIQIVVENLVKAVHLDSILHTILHTIHGILNG